MPFVKISRRIPPCRSSPESRLARELLGHVSITYRIYGTARVYVLCLAYWKRKFGEGNVGGLPTAASVLLAEILERSDCTGLNGAERRLLEAVLIHKTPAGVSPRLIPSPGQALELPF